MNPFLGEIVMFAGNFAPRGWALCDGQLLPIASNSALFSLFGTIYGGDGRTTFALPDLRGRAPVHWGHGPGLTTIALGQRGGIENATLSLLNLPNHTHSVGTMVGTISCNEEDAISDDPQGRNLGVATGGTPYNTNTNDRTMATNIQITTGSLSNSGNSQSFNIRNPYSCVNYIVALQGVFPSRS